MKREFEPLLTRLLSKISIDDNDCWIFMGGKNNMGYGMIRDGKKMRTTHRVSYEEHTGIKVKDDESVGHTCDNYSCVNPDHLQIGRRHEASYGMQGKNHPLTTCEHCGVVIGVNMYARWHGDYCKHNPENK